MDRIKPVLSALSILGLLFTLIVMFALKGDLTVRRPLIVVAITAFSPTVALATVVGPLIEVPLMLALAWGAMRLRPRLFGRASEADGSAG